MNENFAMNPQDIDPVAATEAASQSPQIGQAVDLLEQQIGDMPITAEGVGELVEMLQFALKRPDAWPEIRQAAVADGLADEDDLPREFQPQVIMGLLATLSEVARRAGTQKYARGGLAQAARRVAAAGRGGDTQLAHINPREAAMLRAAGGAGSINPHTGLPEYGFLKSLLKVALPIVLNFVAPGIGGTIGAALGASGTAAAMLGQAVIGGITAGVTGGDPLKGALLGGLTGGLGTAAGSMANEALGLKLGATGQSILGGALVGGGASALTGGNPLKGALAGAAGAGLGAVSQGVGSGAVGEGIGAAGKMAGNMLTAGFKPKEALIGGGLTGLAQGLYSGLRGPAAGSESSGTGLRRPSELVVEGLRAPAASGVGLDPGELKTQYLNDGVRFASGTGAGADYSLVAGGDSLGTGLKPGTGTLSMGPGAASGSKGITDMFSLKNTGTLALLSGALGGAPPQVKQEIQKLSPAQQEYFNRPNVTWDWGRMQSDAAAAGMSLSQYMTSNWPSITGYAAGQGGDARQGAYANAPARLAEGGMYAGGGGALNTMSRLMSGGGSGRDDIINAKLSDGEYVMDAETVALLGDGSTKEGARRLDQMREALRQHKGRKLSRGKISPDAKSPLAYLKEAA